jgi:ArsR family transcriptional regulator, arsenate/arsenite/antimonite-responsive transcriptional repressor
VDPRRAIDPRGEAGRTVEADPSITIEAKAVRRFDACQYVSVASVVDVTESCPPLLDAPLSAEDAERIASAVKVLADPARLRLLSLIQSQPGGEACGCHLTKPLGLGQPTVSHHLSVLREAGLVEREQRGKWAYYRVRCDGLAALRAMLA